MITSTFLAATRSASCTRQLVETTTRPELGCPAQYGCEPGSPGETPLSLTAQGSTTQPNEQTPKRATRVTGDTAGSLADEQAEDLSDTTVGLTANCTHHAEALE